MSNDSFELISDLYKDVYGVRPSVAWLESFNSHPYTKKEEIWKSLQLELESQIDEEDTARKIAYDALKLRLTAMADEYGITLRDALRWDMEALSPEGWENAPDHAKLEWYLFQNNCFSIDSQNEFMDYLEK